MTEHDAARAAAERIAVRWGVLELVDALGLADAEVTISEAIAAATRAQAKRVATLERDVRWKERLADAAQAEQEQAAKDRDTAEAQVAALRGEVERLLLKLEWLA